MELWLDTNSTGWNDFFPSTCEGGPRWEKVSKVAFASFSLIGAAIVISSNGPKKKIAVAHPPTGEGQAPAPPPVEIVEAPPPNPILPPRLPNPIAVNPPLRPVNPIGQKPYDQLRWRDDDRRQIKEIVRGTGQFAKGEINAFTFGILGTRFWGYEKELESIAKGGEPLHPLKFLATVFLDREAREYMPHIFRSSFLKKTFMGGIQKGMLRELKKNNVASYIEPFAREVNVDPERIRPLIQDRAWEPFVRYLIENTFAPRR